MGFEVEYDIFKIWKNAYKGCKKQASIKIKDIYDQILDKIRNDYKSNLKGKTEIDYDELIAFLRRIISYTQEYLNNSKKWSKFYRQARKKAIETLKRATEELIKTLESQKNSQGTLSSIFGSQTVKINKGTKCIPFVLDIPYTGTNFFTIRCYILVKGDGLLTAINGEFNPAKHELVTGKKYTDKNFNFRKIYKVSSTPIKLPLGVGNVNIDVYVSPNDTTSSIALNLVSFPYEILSPSEF